MRIEGVARSFLFFVFAAFTLSFHAAYATQISSHSVNIDVGQSRVSNVSVELKYSELTTSKISYLVFARIDNVAARDSAGAIACSLSRQSYGTEISCTPNEGLQKNLSVALSFNAYNLVSDSDMASLLSYNYAVSDPTEILSVEVALPEAAGLVKPTTGFEPVFPAGWVLGSTGRRTTIHWDIPKPELGKRYIFSANYESISTSYFNLNYALVAIIGVLIVLVLFFRFRVPAYVVKTVMSVLKPDEKRVIDAINQKGTQCKQRDIVRATDFSKAKVSRIIADLEMRGIIEKIRTGRTNRIRLAKEPAARAEVQKKAE